ncbi:WD40/YVTN/BNR-like repeat-containing protein [Gemmatimonas sp.]|uniref:WD40/YVTN/BNR-like repeat-containing protein n=1 Tax=Gemmatimonas sp. TaxID=1962908 RepID=UPI00391D02BF
MLTRLLFRSVPAALCWAAVTAPLASLHAQAPYRAADLHGLRLRSIGPASMSGRVVDMDVVESNPYTMYVAGATGGLWRTTDNGVNWTSIFDAPVHSIGDVAVFQPNPQILWVGTG